MKREDRSARDKKKSEKNSEAGKKKGQASKRLQKC